MRNSEYYGFALKCPRYRDFVMLNLQIMKASDSCKIQVLHFNGKALFHNIYGDG